MQLKFILDIFKNGDSIQPLLLNDEQIFESINYLLNKNFSSWNELKDYPTDNLLIFETDEKSFKIEQTREIINKANIKNSGNIGIIIIKEIDKFTTQAANSLLKILEDVPSGIIFLLTTNAKENILETISSRILYFGDNKDKIIITEESKNAIDLYFNGKKDDLLNIFFTGKSVKNELIAILEYIFEKIKEKNIPKSLYEKIIKSIIKLHSSNANSKFIGDDLIFELEKIF